MIHSNKTLCHCGSFGSRRRICRFQLIIIVARENAGGSHPCHSFQCPNGDIPIIRKSKTILIRQIQETINEYHHRFSCNRCIRREYPLFYSVDKSQLSRFYNVILCPVIGNIIKLSGRCVFFSRI